MPSSSTSSWVDIPPGEDPGAPQGPQPTPRTKAKSGRLGSMMSALGRKGKEDPVKDLMALGYHEDDCRVRFVSDSCLLPCCSSPAWPSCCQARIKAQDLMKHLAVLGCSRASHAFAWTVSLTHASTALAHLHQRMSQVRMQRALFLHANELKAARDWLLERFGAPTGLGITRGLGASLGGNDSPSSSPRGSPVRQQAPRGYEFRPDPSTPTSAGWPTPS